MGGTGGGGGRPVVGQCKKASITEMDEKACGPDGLLLEGEKQEYFLELLMRKASPECPKADQPTKSRDNSDGEAAAAKGKEKKERKKERKALKKSTAEKETGGREEKERATSQDDGLKKQTAPDLVNNPEAKDRGLFDGRQEKKEQPPRPQATSGGKCSGQKTPDYS
jgi:hypothetical protein